MFFSIDKTAQDNFSNHYTLGPFVVSTDSGWQQTAIGNCQIVYKGYANETNLESALADIVVATEPVLTGNFCAIVFNGTTIAIKSDRYRGFPIFVGDQTVTNLITHNKKIWADTLIQFDHNFDLAETQFDVIGPIDVTEISEAEAVAAIDKILSQHIQNFLSHNTLPVKAFLSGGVDSALVYSYIQKYSNNFELLKYTHVDYDSFWLMNSGTIKENFWGYWQVHHFVEPCVVTSGTPGDEFMLRSPVTADLLLKYHGIYLTDVLAKPESKSCMMYSYFMKDKNYKIFKEQQLDPTTDQAKVFWNLANIVINDFQHWHIGNTLTLTLLRDIEIFKILLRLPPDALLRQVMNCDISVQLMNQNTPGISKCISEQKNTGNFLKNLVNLY